MHIANGNNSIVFRFDNGNVSIEEKYNGASQTITASYKPDGDSVNVSSNENSFRSLFGVSSFSVSVSNDNLILNGVNWVDGRDYGNTAIPGSDVPEPEKPVTGDSYFFGTWESTEDLTWTSETFETQKGRVRVSFTDEAVVVWMGATGSSPAMPYTYQKQAEGTYLLNIEGETPMLAMEVNGHLSMTGIINLSFFNGTVMGVTMFDRISQTPDIEADLPPGADSGDVPGEDPGDVPDEGDTNADDFTVEGSTITEYKGTDTDVIIPSSVNGVAITRIDDGAFSGNTAITSVFIPSSITSIGQSAFNECSNLTEVILEPSSEFRSMAAGAFAYTAIEEITIPANTSLFGTFNILIGIFQGCEKLVSVTIADGTSIGHDCFNGCSALKEVILPETLEEINESAFEGCKSLETLELPDGLKIIEDNAFKNSGLRSIAIPSTVTDIGGTAFNGTSASVSISSANRNYAVDENGHIVRKSDRTVLAAYVGNVDGEVSIPSGYTEILDIFRSSDEIESIKIPASLETIGSYSFGYCDNLSSVVFEEGSSLKEIGNYAFTNCGNLKSIDLPEGFTTLGYQCFVRSGISQIGYPRSIEKYNTSFIFSHNVTFNFYGTKAEWDALPAGAKPPANSKVEVICLGDSV